MFVRAGAQAYFGARPRVGRRHDGDGVLFPLREALRPLSLGRPFTEWSRAVTNNGTKSAAKRSRARNPRSRRCRQISCLCGVCLASCPCLLVCVGATRLLVFASLRRSTADRLALSSTACEAGANPFGASHGLLRGDPCSD